VRGLSAGLLIAGASWAFGQADNRPAPFRGRVVDSLTRSPVIGATIEIGEQGVRQTSDSSGRFRFDALTPGQYVLHARHIGYVETVDTVRIEPGDPGEHEFLLRRVAVALEEIVISGRTRRYPAILAPAYQRAARGRGVFFTREDIEQLNPRDYEPLFNRIPGVQANDRGVTFQRCQSGLATLSRSDAKPKVQVWIDGFRVSGRTSSDERNFVYDALRSVKPQSVQIMEVYTGSSNIPAEFLDDACAVIVVWTKRY
jgi:hypothetical protein